MDAREAERQRLVTNGQNAISTAVTNATAVLRNESRERAESLERVLFESDAAASSEMRMADQNSVHLRSLVHELRHSVTNLAAENASINRALGEKELHEISLII